MNELLAGLLLAEWANQSLPRSKERSMSESKLTDDSTAEEVSAYLKNRVPLYVGPAYEIDGMSIHSANPLLEEADEQDGYVPPQSDLGPLPTDGGPPVNDVLRAQLSGLRMEVETLKREKALLAEQAKALQQALASSEPRTPRGACGVRYHHEGCTCNGEGGDR